MVEVFTTNVRNPDHADWVIDLIHESFPDYKANFDLEDCDKILRVECTTDLIATEALIHFLKVIGLQAEVLPDDSPAVDETRFTSCLIRAV